LSQWLVNGLAEAGLPVVCVETRHMKALLKAQQTNKSDRNDARGIAQMMRVGLFKAVHVKTLASQERRMLLGVSEVPNLTAGDQLVSCDGMSADRLFETRVAPYLWNRDIASERGLRMPYTLQIDGGDEALRLKSCRVRTVDGEHDLDLQWRRIDAATALALRRQADGRVVPADLGIKRLNGVWLISIPSFQYQSDTDIARSKSFLAEVASHQAELRAAPKVILDVRGNVGGNSSWGLEVAATIWGRDVVDAAASQFDADSADWRASKSNLQERVDFLRHAEQNGLPESALASLRQSRDLIAQALAAGQPLAAEPRRPTPPAPANLPPRLGGHVYLFTDEVCASACLDFVDVIRRLPNVVHVGRPTSADALYIDIDNKALPSGLMVLGYSMKVYRVRARGNNEGYTPAIAWPGGLMTDAALTSWVSGLPVD
jgi:hypothetical protein